LLDNYTVPVLESATSRAPGDDKVHAMLAACIGITLDPVLKQMFVPREYHPHMVLVEERHIARPQRHSWWFHHWPAVRA